MTYSFTYINEHGHGGTTEVKDLATDQEAMDYASQILESMLLHVKPRSHANGFNDPCVDIDKWENGYPDPGTFGTEDEVEPSDTAAVGAAYDDGTYNDDCTEFSYHYEIMESPFSKH